MKYSIVILAAGLGSRFRQKTTKLPKGLLKINNQEILKWQINNILKSKIAVEDIHIVTGYYSKLIKKFYLNNFKNLKFNFYYNKNYKNTGCIFSFFKTINYIKNDLIYFNSDLVVSTKYLNKLIKSKDKNIILCRRKKNNKSTILQDVIISNGKIKKMDLKLKERTIYEAVGPVKINFKLLKKIKTIRKKINLSFYKKMPCYTFFGKYNKVFNLKSLIINDSDWHEFNNIDDLKKAKNKSLFR